MIKSNIDLNVKGYKVALSKRLLFYKGDTFYLTFSIANTIIDEIDSVEVVNGVLPLTSNVSAYMLLGSDKMTGTIIENNRIRFKIEKEYTEEIGVHYLQLVIVELDEFGEKEILHTPKFAYEVQEPLAYIGDIEDEVAKVDYAIVDKSRVYSLNDDVSEEEVTIGFELWESGEIISKKKLNQMVNILWEHEQKLEELLYKPITVNLSLSKTMVEIGDIVSDLKATWTYNKPPIYQSFNGIVLDNSIRSYSISTNVTTNTTYNLQAKDSKTTINRSVSINFYNGKYYGTSPIPSIYDSSFIMSLNKVLTNNRNGNFTVNCLENNYIYFAIPTRFGKPTFNVGGFEGGFVLVDTIVFTNKFGYTEDYNIYKSENENLGNTTVLVS